MRAFLVASLVAFPALAERPFWDATCSAGHPACFAELAARTRECKVMRKRTADTTVGHTTVEWRKCPITGFSSVRGSDTVVVSNETGGLWAFHNVVDPSSASIRDAVFVGKKLIWVLAVRRNTGGDNWCLLSLATDPPRCIGPSPQELEPREQGLLTESETLQGTQWQITDLQPSRVKAERPIFASHKQVGTLKLALKVRDNVLVIDNLTRE